MTMPVSRLQELAFTLTDANTLYRIDLPPGASRFKIQPRGQRTVKVRFNRGAAGAPTAAPEDSDPYWTLAGVPGQYIEAAVTAVGSEPRTLYAESPEAGTVVEILVGI